MLGSSEGTFMVELAYTEIFFLTFLAALRVTYRSPVTNRLLGILLSSL
jgi:hypothetical protein